MTKEEDLTFERTFGHFLWCHNKSLKSEKPLNAKTTRSQLQLREERVKEQVWVLILLIPCFSYDNVTKYMHIQICMYKYLKILVVLGKWQRGTYFVKIVYFSLHNSLVFPFVSYHSSCISIINLLNLQKRWKNRRKLLE